MRRRIRQRIGEIVFNSSLVAEMQSIAAMRAMAARGEGPSSMRELRLHRIGPPPRDLIDARIGAGPLARRPAAPAR